jgi:hypothetical protein
MCMFWRSLFVLLSFFFWPLCCLFFDLHARSFNTPRSHSADFSNQSKGTEADRPMVSPFYAKYGNSSQSRNMLGYPDDEGEFSASSESMPSKSGSVPSYRTLHGSLVLCVCFEDHCLSFCPFSFGHCVVYSLIYGFWFPLWYLLILLHV